MFSKITALKKTAKKALEIDFCETQNKFMKVELAQNRFVTYNHFNANASTGSQQLTPIWQILP